VDFSGYLQTSNYLLRELVSFFSWLVGYRFYTRGKKLMRNHGKTQPEVIEMKEYEILFDTGKVRKLVAQINKMAKEGWQAISIGGLGAPTGVSAVYVLMEREVG
jgi:hypothetical protein